MDGGNGAEEMGDVKTEELKMGKKLFNEASAERCERVEEDAVEKCGRCDGSGLDPDTMTWQRCKACGGSGKMKVVEPGASICTKCGSESIEVLQGPICPQCDFQPRTAEITLEERYFASRDEFIYMLSQLTDFYMGEKLVDKGEVTMKVTVHSVSVENKG